MADKKKEEQEAEAESGQSKLGQTTVSEQEGANQLQQDQTSGKVFGDTTSSSGGANIPGYHGRDGGVAEGTTNNPAAEQGDSEAEAEEEQEAPTKL